MRRILLMTVLSFTVSCLLWSQNNRRQLIDLSGRWDFQLDPQDKGIGDKLWKAALAESVTLPGTTDSNRKGDTNTNRSETTYLSRYYKYEGAAWYSKSLEIPAE